MKPFPFKIVDLTHALSADIPTWEGACGFDHRVHYDYDDDPSNVYKFRTHKISMNEGVGTHMDSPAHCFPGGRHINQLELGELIAPCVLIDVSAKAHASYSVSVQDVANFEKSFGPISKGSFVITHTGWGKRWSSAANYRNDLVFPDISKEAADLLLSRGIVGLGIDTLSPDRPDEGFAVHAAVLGAGKYVVENIANAESLSPMGSYTAVLPMKIAEGTEAPVRLIAFV